jgi:hypothetical protein
MDITPLQEVSAGQPITAQAWNAIVTAINTIVEHLNSTEATSVKVTITNAGLDLASARVTAIRESDQALAEAVAPVPPATEFQFAGLRAGPYTLRAEAPGFAVSTQAITVASSPVSVSLTLQPAAAFMPLVLGQTLQASLATLSNVNIKVQRVLDVTGRDVPPANPGADYNDQPVLVQFPDPGKPVPPADSALLVVAAALRVEASIEMPSLAGLSLAEAQKALEGLGLVLGRVVSKQQTPQ